jgi:rhodanese-related sulfurtransferase
VDVPEIDVDALAKLHAEGATVIDVPGARLIPLPEVADRVAEVPGGEPVYVICAMGGRSRRACEFLLGQGLDVTNIAGGTNGWIEAGQPVTTGTEP